jgi:hypothetical protein
MSLILFSTLTTAALWAKARSDDRARKNKPKEKEIKPTVAESYQHSGTYGDFTNLSTSLKSPGFFVDEKFDTDLLGVPCRWMIAKNGGVYKTYDLDTNLIY